MAAPGGRRKELCLETDFTLEPGQEEVACVDLAEEWPEDAAISRHPGYSTEAIQFVKGEVGEGGDHMNITLKNTSQESVTIKGSEVVVVLQEKTVEGGLQDMEVSEAPMVNGDKAYDDQDSKDKEETATEKTSAAKEETEDMETNGEASKEEEDKDKDDEATKEGSESPADQNGEVLADGETTATEEAAKEKEATAETEASAKHSGITPDKIDLAACKTPAKATEAETEVTEGEDKNKNGEEAEESSKKAAPTMTMRFVDETVNQGEDKDESMDTDKAGDEAKAKDEDKSKDEDKDKPSSGLKLADFSTMAHKEGAPAAATEAPKDAPVTARPVEDDCCAQCESKITNPFDAIVWETMQFCNESCLGLYQGCMSSCSSCRKEVVESSLGKYCVRFGSDIKQFCSNVCLEDYKKGLKVCSYCQKDISGGEGFLAPIGDKGQFKDFCEQACLKKYQHIHLGIAPDPETLPCGVCKDVRKVEREILRTKETVKLCGDACFNAFKFVNTVDTLQCDLCAKHFDTAADRVKIHYEGLSQIFCSKPCQNVFVMQKRKIVPCTYCKVKKYNFDMIEKFPLGQAASSQLYCSLTCLNLHTQHQAKFPGVFPSSLPVISAVSSLASPALQPPLQQQVQMQTQTVREVVRETHILPSEQPAMKNKGVSTKPFMLTKGVSCRPHPCHKETQTEGLTQPVPIPIPVPIHVPTPCKMYNAPFPVPVPIPLPFPVPIFIPTTRRSMKGIEKIIKKILNKIPADPFEAELLALAGTVGGEGGDSSDSESDPGEDREDYEREVHPEQPPEGDLETEMSGERILPKPLPTTTPDPLDRQRAMGVYNQASGIKRRQSDGNPDDPDDPAIKIQYNQGWPQQQQRGRRNNNRGRPRGGTNQSPAVKRFRADQSITHREQQAAIQAIQQQPKERPDANHHLKFTYGVNAWKHWVVGKNAELEKQRAQGKYQKTFETDILKLRADELNFTLCMFVKEVKKPNGDQYAADSIFYLVLGIQEYLFENGRIDNIFTDTYYDPFTSALHEVVKDFKLPVNELGYFVTRIEEEHLWEAKQLGAHSPQVLLNTLVYFNTKYFQLKTVDQHLKLSFSHIMKHWKKTPLANKPGQQQRTVLLRYYPPPAKGQKPEDRKMYEQHESHENPLRCPVKLYEFYLSKCPESTKNRNDMFYLQPERSCVPDSPVWYSAQLLNRFNMEKMLDRLLMVREVQEHMLADQAS